ncbi:hypothetical protein [Vulgatibacter incomptus]|uniref:Glycosyl hydrolase, BNR repeat protein n=1 Tax=Vulgatibacter incomptus TaxID=1391653 RepID=A0A0K1PF14_9BACT|nr:hypothetical protein [Vulgatibacter incomptus]AKU92110.1 Glycosyl hydrolase, BNR repeat protein [Vulgatibacter incomptus]
MKSRTLALGLLALTNVGCGGSRPPEAIPNDGGPVRGAFFRPLDAKDSPTANLFAIWGDGAGSIWAAGEGGRIARLQDGAWEAMETPVDRDLRSIWGRAPDDVYAVGVGGAILHFRPDPDEGGEPVWVAEAAPVEVDLNAVAGGGGRIYAAGAEGTILSRDEDGVWTVVPPVTFETINGLMVDGSGRGLAVGNLGLLLRGDQAGVWRRQRLDGINLALRAVWGPDTSSFYAVGLDGTILRGSPDGDVESIPGAPKVFLRDVRGTSMGDAWVVGWGGTVVHLDGRRAEIVANVTDYRLEGVWGGWELDPESGEGLVRFYVVGVNGTVLAGP